MEYVTIPHTDLKASRVALGTWAIGGKLWGGTDEGESIRTIQEAVHRGISLIDTAPVYGFGVSEEFVGKALKGLERDSVVVATKAGLAWDNGKVVRNSTPARLRQEVDDSLRRLGLDVIDLYQIHWPDPLVPIEETAGTLRRLREEGKIRAAGVSNYSPQQMEIFSAEMELSTAQPPYNLFERGIEGDILPYTREKGVGLLTYGALCRGLLSGRMSSGTEFTGDDIRKWDPKFKQPRFTQYLEAVRELNAFAADRYGKSVLSLAVRWILDRGVETALWGARHPGQLAPLEEILGYSVSDQDAQEIDGILKRTISDPVGPEFMAPPARQEQMG